MIKQTYGKRLRELRQAKGYSQEKVGQLCGLDRTYIASVEAGKRNISLENMEKIAAALNISLSDFCNWEQPIHRTILLHINGESFIVEADRELTPDIKDHIDAICECVFDEDSSLFDVMEEDTSLEDIYNMSVYELAEKVLEAVKAQVGIDLVFKAIDLEERIASD